MAIQHRHGDDDDVVSGEKNCAGCTKKMWTNSRKSVQGMESIEEWKCFFLCLD